MQFMKRLKNVHREFSGGPVVRTPSCRGMGLTPGLLTMCGHTRYMHEELRSCTTKNEQKLNKNKNVYSKSIDKWKTCIYNEEYPTNVKYYK